MKLKLSISTCPNDTFMFDALLHGRIDTEGLEFDLHMADIEQINIAAKGPEAPDISKLSYAAYPAVRERYYILQSGSALGRGNGPLFIGREPLDPAQLANATVAVPGLQTTANRLLTILYPWITRHEALLFSDIAPAVVRGDYPAGVLIHEGRFTYRAQGLHLIADLGLEWERRSGLPLPLGAIVVSRTLPDETQRTIDRVLHRSIAYAMSHPEASYDFVRRHAQELSDTVIRSHIELFVNEYSLALGDEGRQAVRTLLGFDDNDNIFVA